MRKIIQDDIKCFNRIFLVFIFSMSVLICANGQSEPDDVMRRGLYIYKIEKDTLKAAKYYEGIKESVFLENDSLYINACFHLGSICFNISDLEKAKKNYLEILNYKIQNVEPIEAEYKGYIDFEFQLVSMKKKACLSLAKISIKEKQYSLALEYIKTHNEKYKIGGSAVCGNGGISDVLNIRLLKAKCYSGLSNGDSLFQEIGHLVFGGHFLGFSIRGNEIKNEIQTIVSEYIVNNYSSEIIKSEINNVEIEIRKSERGRRQAYVKFFGRDFYPYDSKFDPDSKKIGDEEIIKYYTEYVEESNLFAILKKYTDE